MRVRNLGALIVAVDGVEQPLAGSKAAAILALLVINANRRVSVDSLMDAAWGDRVNSGSVSTLESHIWRLRQLLEPGRTSRQPSGILINEAGGYRLFAEGHSIDSLRFEEIAGDVQGMLAAGDARAAVALADEGLTLWRGQPYGSLAERDWARPAVSKLEEIHFQLVERRIDALIGSGDVGRALVDLQPLLAETQFREHLWAQQMLATYRSGRIEQALDTFHRARAALVEGLGTEPGPELQSLHRRILDNDPGLLGTAASVRSEPEAVEVNVPAIRNALRGRENDLSRLAELVAARPLVSVVGPAGCGKTRLAMEVGRRAAGQFPDGVWFVDLDGTMDPSLLVDVITSTIGFAPSPGATPVEDLAHYLRARRMLLILDNCEHLLAAVADLAEIVLGRSDDSVAFNLLATSREPIDVAGETVWTLGPLEIFGSDTPAGAGATSSPAVQLLLDRLASAAPDLTVTAAVVDQAAAICAAVDGLPLAIELAGARARSFSLEDILAQVTTDPTSLGRTGRAATGHRTTLRSAIEWSHRMLTPAEQLAHRRLAALPGTFSRGAAEAVLAELAADQVADVLAALVHRSMLTSTASRRPGGPTVFSQLATVRAHARHRLTDAGELAATTRRRNRWAMELIDARPRLGSAAEPGWYDRLDDNYPTVRAVLSDLLTDQPDASGVRLASRLGYYWYYRARTQEGARWLRSADGVAGRDPMDVALVRLALASVLAVQGRIDLARPYIRDTVAHLPATYRRRLVEVGEALVGVAIAVWVRDAVDLVQEVHVALADVAARAADEQLTVLADAVGSIARTAAGDFDEGAIAGAAVYDRSVALENNTAGWIAAGPPMIAALLNSRPAEGIPWVERVMRGHLRVRSAAGGMFIETRANFAAQSGDHHQAARLYAAARTQTRRAAMVWPRRSITEGLLRETETRLSAAEYARAWQEGERLTLEQIAST